MILKRLKHLIFVILAFLTIDYVISVVVYEGLTRYYGFKNAPEILINGSSMSMSGLDSKLMETSIKKNVAMYAREGVNVQDRLVMLKHFFSEHKSTIAVVYEINPLLFSEIPTSANAYSLFYPFMDNKDIQNYIWNRTDWVDYAIHRWIRCTRFNAQLLIASMRGYLNKYSNYKTGLVDPQELASLKGSRNRSTISMNEVNIENFRESMNIISEHKATTLLVMMPMVKEKLETFDSVSYQSFSHYFEQFAKENKNVIFFNLNTDPSNCEAVLFSDPLHLNEDGQRTCTELINEELKKMLLPAK
jgi:hypothetical protein